MPWDSSKRRQDPPGWKALRQKVITRAQGQCEQSLSPLDLPQTTIRCSYPGRDVDHIVNVARGGSNDLSNLQLLCEWHHKQKTQAEAKANRPRITERHPGEKHPGIRE
jgi:5-methylcytosine-specific restriction protein A